MGNCGKGHMAKLVHLEKEEIADKNRTCEGAVFICIRLSPGNIWRTFLKFRAGSGVRLFMFQPGIDTVTTACGLIAVADFYVMLSEILAVFAHWINHIITSDIILCDNRIKVNMQ